MPLEKFVLLKPKPKVHTIKYTTLLIKYRYTAYFLFRLKPYNVDEYDKTTARAINVQHNIPKLKSVITCIKSTNVISPNIKIEAGILM